MLRGAGRALARTGLVNDAMAEAQTTPFSGRTAWGRNLAAPVRDFLSTVTNTVPDGLYVIDEEGRLTLANRAAEELLGWPTEELLGEPMHDKMQMTTVTMTGDKTVLACCPFPPPQSQTCP